MNFTLLKNNAGYPPLLNEVGDSPDCLFARGQPLNPNEKYFAVVGTRHPSPYGVRIAEDFTTQLVQYGFVIVSGLAYGIDTIAHEAALSAGGRTIAILGSGLNHIGPVSNYRLAQRIEKDGCILTEYPPQEPAYKEHFPARNRIIAGMSLATLVIEAPERSGALITARFALEYNRSVFAIPGNITQETSKGANMLIRDSKAHPALSVNDMLEYMNINVGDSSQKSKQALLPILSPDEELIYKLLKRYRSSIDTIAQETGLPIAYINRTLSLLELKGLVKTHGSYSEITR